MLSPTHDDEVDVAACAQLGLAGQWRQVIIDRHSDGTEIYLAGYGELGITLPSGEHLALDLQQTAHLIQFFHGDNTQALAGGILRAALLARGGTVAELTRWLDTMLDRVA